MIQDYSDYYQSGPYGSGAYPDLGEIIDDLNAEIDSTADDGRLSRLRHLLSLASQAENQHTSLDEIYGELDNAIDEYKCDYHEEE